MPLSLDFVLKLRALGNGYKIGKAFGFLPAAVGTLWKVGNLVCLEAPKKMLNFCLQTQKQILFMPYRCVSGFYKLIRRYLKPNVPVKQAPKSSVNGGNFPSAPRNQTLDALTLLTGGDERPTTVISQMKLLTRSSLKAISKMETCNLHSKGSKKIHKRNCNDRKCDIFKIAAEEKKLISVIAAGLKYIKSLQNKREILDDSFSGNQKLFFTTRVATMKRLLDSFACEDLQSEVTLEIKDKHDKLTDLLGKAKVMENNIQWCLNSLSPDTYTGQSSHLREPIVLNDSIEILQTVAGIVSSENSALRHRLAVTNEKLEEVLKSSNALMDELVKLSEQFEKMCSLTSQVAELQDQLNKARELLSTVEADRDEMKIKLITLGNMIKEEEDFLDDTSESGLADSMF